MRTTHTLVTLLPIYLAKFSKMLVKTLQTRTSEQAGQALEREGRGAEVQGREREQWCLGCGKPEALDLEELGPLELIQVTNSCAKTCC